MKIASFFIICCLLFACSKQEHRNSEKTLKQTKLVDLNERGQTVNKSNPKDTLLEIQLLEEVQIDDKEIPAK